MIDGFKHLICSTFVVLRSRFKTIGLPSIPRRKPMKYGVTIGTVPCTVRGGKGRILLLANKLIFDCDLSTATNMHNLRTLRNDKRRIIVGYLIRSVNRRYGLVGKLGHNRRVGPTQIEPRSNVQWTFGVVQNAWENGLARLKVRECSHHMATRLERRAVANQ